jgi:hypothetical protein
MTVTKRGCLVPFLNSSGYRTHSRGRSKHFSRRIKGINSYAMSRSESGIENSLSEYLVDTLIPKCRRSIFSLFSLQIPMPKNAFFRVTC